MTFALHVTAAPQESPPPSPAHTLSHLSTLQLCPTLSLSHRLPATPPLPPLPPVDDSLIADWSFQVTSGPFPCLPNITGWPRPRNPAWAREGAEVHTHTNTHNDTAPHTHFTQTGRTGAALRSILNTFHPLVLHGGVLV